MRRLVFVFIGMFFSQQIYGMPVEENCDLPKHTLVSVSLPNAKACAEKCEQQDECQGFSFISHWNRCFLKSKVGKVFSIRMFSGQVSKGRGGKRQVAKVHEFADSTGKDIKVTYEQRTVDDCQKLCLANDQCHSFSYLRGYAMCAQKKAGGKIVEKRFSCGVKAKSP